MRNSSSLCNSAATSDICGRERMYPLTAMRFRNSSRSRLWSHRSSYTEYVNSMTSDQWARPALAFCQKVSGDPTWVTVAIRGQEDLLWYGRKKAARGRGAKSSLLRSPIVSAMSQKLRHQSDKTCQAKSK